VGDGISGRGEARPRNGTKPRKERVIHPPATAGDDTRLGDGARPRSRRSRSSHRDGPAYRKGNRRGEAVIGQGTARGQRTRRRVPAVDEEFFEGYGPALRESSGRSRSSDRDTRPAETRWTPGSAAGCNKPAPRRPEETVEVVRNHEDGTGLRGWNPRSRSDDWPSSREWTVRVHVDGGATGASPGSRGSDVWTETQERRPTKSARAIGTAPRRSEGVEVRADVLRDGRRTGSGTLEGEPGNRETPRRARERPTTRGAPRPSRCGLVER